MEMIKRQIGKRWEDNNSKGFSLIEVLVCIALLAIISVPIFSSFRLSAHNTSRAHKNQKVTAYAQDTLEKIKSMEVSEFESMILNAFDKDGVKSGTSSTKIDTVQQAKFDLSYPEELFTTIICKSPNIDIGGEIYDMEVAFDPNYYSTWKVPAGDDTSADNANVYAVNDVKAVDGMLFPVISDEISSYEGGASAPGGVLYNLLAQAKDNQLAALGVDEAERLLNLYQYLDKKVKVIIKSNGPETRVTHDGVEYAKGSLRVACEVTYETTVNGVNLKQVYHVFSGTYDSLGKVIKRTGYPDEIEWERGGRIYIFAKAYQDQFHKSSVAFPTSNKLEIQNLYSGTGMLDIHLVRGYYFDVAALGEITNKRGLNFTEITVSDGSSSKVYADLVNTSDEYTGEAQHGKTKLHTNVKKPKSVALTKELTAFDIEQTIGKENPSLRCYVVTISIKKSGTSKEVARITTTKNVK